MITQLIGLFMVLIGLSGISDPEPSKLALLYLLVGTALFFVKGSSE